MLTTFLLAAALMGGLGQNATETAGQAGVTPSHGGTRQEILEEARAAAGHGRLEQALGLLKGLSEGTEEPAGVERLRGMILYQQGNMDLSLMAFEAATQQDPADRQSTEMRGVTLYRLGRAGEAIPFLEKARGVAVPVPQGGGVGHAGDLELGGAAGSEHGLNVEPQYVLGLCYTDARRYDDARRAFAGQFGFGPDSAEGYLVAARLFLRREFADVAARFAAKALELNPGLPLAHQLLGEVALAKADLPLAVKELETEEKLNPLNGAMYDRLGDAYARNGQYEEARQALNKAVLLEPNTTGPYILLGQALVKLGEPVEAVHYLQRAVSMDPANYVAHTALGQAYRALGQMADANREYKLAVEIQHRADPKPAGVK